jgi:hypothetical protein
VRALKSGKSSDPQFIKLVLAQKYNWLPSQVDKEDPRDINYLIYANSIQDQIQEQERKKAERKSKGKRGR